MAIAVYRATSDATALTIQVCPNYANSSCGCTKDGNGNPLPPHPVFTWAPDPPDSRALATYQSDCATEALRLVTAATATPNVTTLSTLVGMTI